MRDVTRGELWNDKVKCELHNPKSHKLDDTQLQND